MNVQTKGNGSPAAGRDLTIKTTINNFASVNLFKLSSIMSSILSAITQEVIKEEGIFEISPRSGFTIEDKIAHNHIVRYKYLITDLYGSYSGVIDQLFDSLELQRSGIKNIFLNHFIYGKYLLAKGTLCQNGELITEKGDDVIDFLVKDISEYYSSLIEQEGFFGPEHLTTGVMCVVCWAFNECKVLENPNTQG